MSNIITFPAIYKDGELLPEVLQVSIRFKDVVIVGESKKPAWDNFKLQQVKIYGFFISYKGIEYGTILMTEYEFLSAGRNGNCTDGYRVHAGEFSIEYD